MLEFYCVVSTTPKSKCCGLFLSRYETSTFFGKGTQIPTPLILRTIFVEVTTQALLHGGPADRRTGGPTAGGGGGSLLNSSPGLKKSGKSKCVANHVDVQRCYSSVFHRMPPLRLGLDRAHAPTSTWSALTLLGFYIVKRLGMSASNIGAKRAALRTTRVFDSSNEVHFTPPHF